MKTFNNKLKTLEFLIPSYKRPQTLIQAVESVAKQIEELKLSERVKITVVDDCSPNITGLEILESISQFRHFVTFTKNDVNKGMSLNIRDMVANSSASFCSVLTDDDRLQPNSLKQIIETIDNLNNGKNSPVIGSFFVPRYSYLEDQSLGCIVCDPFEKNTIIKPSPMSSIQYLDNGFILTGLFFRPKLINFQLWNENIENSFFPVIYFADLLLNYECLFIKENWFVHTVLNECHWDSWGKTEQGRSSRLYKDYMEAVTLSSQIALSRASNILQRIYLRKQEFLQYINHMFIVLSQLDHEHRIVGDLTSSQWPYNLALIYFYDVHPIQSGLAVLFYRLKQVIKLLVKPPVNSI
jgi:glycosyltransferase involved in cell wall biosynthesis